MIDSDPNTSSGIICVGHRWRGALILDSTATVRQYQQSSTEEHLINIESSVIAQYKIVTTDDKTRQKNT
jgi:hypothetical protein